MRAPRERRPRGLGAGWAGVVRGWARQEEVDVGDAAGVGRHALSRLLQHLTGAQPPRLRAARCPHPARSATHLAARRAGPAGERASARREAVTEHRRRRELRHRKKRQMISWFQ